MGTAGITEAGGGSAARQTPLAHHALKVVGGRRAKAEILALHEEKLFCPALE